jgi:hypothetical protein
VASSGGHWDTLAAAEKLTQSVQVSGFLEEDILAGGLMGMLPFWQLTGKSLKWLEEKTVQTASPVSVGSQLTWTDAVDYNEREMTLKQYYIQTPLNKFVAQTYGNINNYEAIQLVENKKAMMKKLNNDFIYGDTTYSAGNLELDGIHALAEAKSADFDGNADVLDIDEGEAGLSLANLRGLEDEMKYGIDFWLFPLQIARRLDAYVQENGLSTFTAGNISFTLDDMGRRVSRWNGVPIIRSRYLVAEQANTGVGSDARAKNSSGDKQYSVFAVKMGNVAAREPGLTMCFGGDNMRQDGDIMRIDRFDKLEDFDASGLRLVSYAGLADGTSMALGRIYDIEDVAVVA